MSIITPGLTKKFYLGVFLVLGSMILGGITKITFLFYFSDPYIRWTSVVIYLLSWPALFVGVILIGQEYYKSIKRYMSYKFYHENAKKGAKHVYHRTKHHVNKRMKKKPKRKS